MADGYGGVRVRVSCAASTFQILTTKMLLAGSKSEAFMSSSRRCLYFMGKHAQNTSPSPLIGIPAAVPASSSLLLKAPYSVGCCTSCALPVPLVLLSSPQSLLKPSPHRPRQCTLRRRASLSQLPSTPLLAPTVNSSLNNHLRAPPTSSRRLPKTRSPSLDGNCGLPSYSPLSSYLPWPSFFQSTSPSSARRTTLA